MSQAIVRQHCPNYLIMRCVTLLGKHARKNSLLRILYGDSCTLTLHADSQFNYVLHSDVCNFISFALQENISGIFNVASKENVSLAEIANLLNKKVNFGNYRYDVGKMDNTKISSIFPVFNKTSTEVVQEFINQLEGFR